MIHYLKHNEIDMVKWDQCIDRSPNGLVYGYSFYLDTMSKHWDALILDDYQAVMPLTWNRKYGIAYLYQPFFTAALGVFGNKPGKELVVSFLRAIPDSFRYWDIYLNHENVFDVPGFELYVRSNFILDLNHNYKWLNERIAESHKRNIRRAEQLGCYVKKDIPVEDIIGIAREQSRKYSPVTPEEYNKFAALYKQLNQKKKAITYGVYNKNGELLSSCVWFFSHSRAYYILVGNNPNSKTYGASHLLIHTFIKEHAGENLVIDFEGSDVSSLAFFYSRFGAEKELYAGIKRNKLPRLLKWLKS